MFESYEDILSVETVCEILGIGRNNMYKLLSSGQLKAFKNGRVWRISKKALEEFVLQQRTREGIETARLNGKQIGQARGAKLTTQKAIATKKVIRFYSKDFDGTLSDKDCIKLIGCARGTYYKYKRELREEME